jgi:hypothetical protein
LISAGLEETTNKSRTSGAMRSGIGSDERRWGRRACRDAAIKLIASGTRRFDSISYCETSARKRL